MDIVIGLLFKNPIPFHGGKLYHSFQWQPSLPISSTKQCCPSNELWGLIFIQLAVTPLWWKQTRCWRL